MKTELRYNEIIEELEGGIKIIANTALYRYTSDSVRLAKTVNANRKDKILDLCTGGGIVALMLAHLTASEQIDGLELQSDLCDMARRSVELNDLQSKIKVINGDLLTFNGGHNYDIVTCNPPYYKINTGEMRSAKTCDVARHELCCTLKDTVTSFNKALKFGGVGYMVHKCERLSEVISAFSACGLEPKQLTLYYSGNKACDTFVIKVKKGAKPGMAVICSEI